MCVSSYVCVCVSSCLGEFELTLHANARESFVRIYIFGCFGCARRYGVFGLYITLYGTVLQIMMCVCVSLPLRPTTHDTFHIFTFIN